jgi:hypothetical protein
MGAALAVADWSYRNRELRSPRRLSGLGLVLLIASVAGCSCDGGRETRSDSGFDSGFTEDAGEEPMDAGFDSGFDSGTVVDSGSDSGIDAGMVDAGPGIICAPDSPNACADASMRTITVGPNTTAFVSGVVDGSGDDYFVVNFTPVGGASTPYHPRIRFIANPSNLYTFTLESSCGVDFAGCSGARTTWEMNFPGSAGICGLSTCIDNDARLSSMIVRVRRSAWPNNCRTYSIEISNMP